MDIGKSIKYGLVDSGLTSTEVAKQVGVTNTHFSRLKGQTTCSGEMLEKLAGVFGMPVSQFVALGEK